MRALLLGLVLLLHLNTASFAQEHLGYRWTCNMRVSMSYDITPPQRLAAPSFRSVPLPEYPAEAMRAGLTGITKIQFVLKDDGVVSDAVISNSSGVDLLDTAALSAVRKWLFYRFGEEVQPGRFANRYSGPIKIEAVLRFEIPEE
jgi:TonB family protein